MKINAVDRNRVSHEIVGVVGESLMRALAETDLVEATCGGACSCATCHIYVDATWHHALPLPSATEAALIDGLLHTNTTSRLACQIVCAESLDGIAVTVAPE